MGGPIFKDRLFFFADYQGLRQATPPQASTTTVMPLAWRNGDFSSLLNPALTGGKTLQLYNPDALDPATGLRAPFPNNVIPTSLLSLAALNDQSLYPAPQTSSFTTPNYFLAQNSFSGEF